ncbi:Smr domain [Geosmithia morbida]|uniref:Smr domain n=1 Tax=Geosmithia morbida TaxID=1094350 RepID=A0A9P4YU47_9HYPO|nr:Smr domain [Geosmithia morbida]KAF4122110.1 Smr domain [Geosmithia morbida]
MAHKDGDPLERLVESFRTLLDDTVVVAIAGDYDLDTFFGYKAAEDTLKDLSQNVVFEEATGFDPSGHGYDGAEEEMDPSRDDDLSTSTTSASRQASRARRTTVSSSTDTSSTPADSASAVPRLTTFNDYSDKFKFVILWDMFSELKEYDVKHALKKANGDFQSALDDLLNIQFLQSTGQQQRGIDAFFQPDDTTAGPAKGKKKKSKKGKRPISNTPESAVDSTSKEVLEKSQAKELKHQDEISFLSDRMNMPFDEVLKVYYRRKCSAGAAAAEIIDTYISLGITSEDEQAREQVKKLSAEYSNVPESHLSTLLQITGNPLSCNEIAALLSRYFIKNPWTQRLDLSHRITPLPDEDLEGPMGPLSPASNSDARISISGKAGRAAAVAAKPSRSAASPADLESTIGRISISHQAKREASAYASQLYRRGASNSLYRQAAIVYRERAVEHTNNAHQLTSAAADLLVRQTSTKTSIDLHGVTVRDGTRIAREKARQWWDELGEFRSRRAQEQPLTIITGIGKHTASGVSQLRQAVAATLLRDGWKMRVETGRFVLTGRR